MRIGALARETGVSERLLRYYEEQGLLRPARGANGYREYTGSDVVAVSHIRSLLAAGLPTTVIAQVLDCVHDVDGRLTPEPCPGMVGHLSRERARIAGAITRLATAQRALDALLSLLPDPAVGHPPDPVAAHGAGETGVVGDHQQGAPELGERPLGDLEGVEVEVVGGLVEQQDAGRRVRHDGQQQAAQFTGGERA
jgi:DNA-binding transcriptional MerR regulator